MKLEELLEDAKTNHFGYAVTLMYGSPDVGCDDSGGRLSEREFQLMMTPGGYLGEVRRLIVTTADKIDEIDLGKRPIKVDNPPPRDVIRNPGDYCWGPSADDYLKEFGSPKQRQSRLSQGRSEVKRALEGD